MESPQITSAPPADITRRIALHKREELQKLAKRAVESGRRSDWMHVEAAAISFAESLHDYRLGRDPRRFTT